MSQFKEFQGRTLDEAISEACEYYGVAREKLEIEILSDAKTGIFGLVGVKKASIRAARMQLPGAANSLMEEKEPRAASQCAAGSSRQKTARNGGQDQEKQPPLSGAFPLTPEVETSRNGLKTSHGPGPRGRQTSGSGRGSEAERKRAAAQPREKSRNRNGAGDQSAPRQSHAPTPGMHSENKPRPGETPENAGIPGESSSFLSGPEYAAASNPASDTAMGTQSDDMAESLSSEASLDSAREDLPEFDLEHCDRDKLISVVREVVLRLVEPIVGQAPCEISIGATRVRAVLDCGDAAGLLVGRDGQTLASVQYLATRIISRQLGGAVRVQVDAGKYRERQDDKIKEMALSLAARVKETGRSLSTRPLSAYQRRIVHLALEGDEAVLTNSKGEGTQRKVVIYLNRNTGGRAGGRGAHNRSGNSGAKPDVQEALTDQNVPADSPSGE